MNHEDLRTIDRPAREEHQAANDTCGSGRNCGKPTNGQLHPCPFMADTPEADEAVCDCCEQCTKECAYVD